MQNSGSRAGAVAQAGQFIERTGAETVHAPAP